MTDEKEKLIYLNLGCGNNYRENWCNVDFVDRGQKVDVWHDLNTFPLPWDDNSVTLIAAEHVIEHVQNIIQLFKELHRILKPGGILYIRVPEFPCAASVADFTHVHYFVPATFGHIVNPNAGFDTSGVRGDWTMRYIESLKHDRPDADRGNLGSYFTELEVELEAVK
jgi:SAM-dependent methyltransferase